MDSRFDLSSPNSGAFRSQSRRCFVWTNKFVWSRVYWFGASETVRHVTVFLM